MCQCSCGIIKEVKGKLLQAGLTKSCGCLRSLISQAHAFSNDKDLTGKIIGKLFVLEKDISVLGNKYTSGYKVHPRYICKCECGNIKSISSNELNKKRKSCGCKNFR